MSNQIWKTRKTLILLPPQFERWEEILCLCWTRDRAERGAWAGHRDCSLALSDGTSWLKLMCISDWQFLWGHFKTRSSIWGIPASGIFRCCPEKNEVITKKINEYLIKIVRSVKIRIMRQITVEWTHYEKLGLILSTCIIEIFKMFLILKNFQKRTVGLCEP